MYSLLLIALAAVNAVIAIRVFPVWARSRSTLLLFTLAALVAVTLEALFAGLGRWIEVGEQLARLHGIALLIATFAVPLSLFTLATLARRLGFSWALIDWGHGAVCLFASALLIASLPGLLALDALQAACWQDVLWYQRAVPPALACAGVAASMGEGSWAAALVLPIVLIAWFLFGAGLWQRDRRPWLLAGATCGLATLWLPVAWGPVPRLAGTSVAFVGIVLTVARHADRLAPPPPTDVAHD